MFGILLIYCGEAPWEDLFSTVESLLCAVLVEK